MPAPPEIQQQERNVVDDEDVTSAPTESSSFISKHPTSTAVRPHARTSTRTCFWASLALVALSGLAFFFAPSSVFSTSNPTTCSGDLLYSDCVAPCSLTCSPAIEADCNHPCWPGCQCPSDRPYLSLNDTCVESFAHCPKPTSQPSGYPTRQPTPPTSFSPTIAKASLSPTALTPWKSPNVDAATDLSSCEKAVPATSVARNLTRLPDTVIQLVRASIAPCPPARADVALFIAATSSVPCSQFLGLQVAFWHSPAARKLTPTIDYFCHPSGKSFVHFAFARLYPLEPGKRLSYEVGGLAAEGPSAPRYELTAPLLPGEASSSNEAFVMGDSGFRKPVDNGFASMYKLSPQVGLLVHVGDQSYVTNNGACWGDQLFGNPNSTCGWNCEGDACIYSARGGDFGSFFGWTSTVDQSLGGRIVWMTTMGNHDNDPGWFFANRPPLRAALPNVSPSQFPKPLNGMSSFKNLEYKPMMHRIVDYLREPLFYSFDYGLVHVVSYGTEDNPNNGYERWDSRPLSPMMLERFNKHYGVESAQYAFLQADLAKASAPAQRAKVPWIILMTHRPMYHTASHHPNCGGGGDWSICMVRELYEPLLAQYGVNIVFSGHSHHYQRTWPLYHDKKSANGTVHIIVGTGGFELLGEHWNRNTEWMAHRQSSRFGFGHYKVYNATHLYWQHIAFENHTVLDQSWIVNNRI